MSAVYPTGRVHRKGVLHAISGFSGSAMSLCGYRCRYDVREGDAEPTCKWCRERLNLGTQSTRAATPDLGTTEPKAKD